MYNRNCEYSFFAIALLEGGGPVGRVQGEGLFQNNCTGANLLRLIFASIKASCPPKVRHLTSWAEMNFSAISGSNLSTQVLYDAVPYITHSYPLVRG